MSMQYEKFKNKAFLVFGDLARECPEFDDARMLVASSEATASLVKNDVYKTIDTKWIDAIEKALPSLDAIIRNPIVAIEDVDEVLPVELSRHISEKSVKHLAQHTNLILDVKDGEIIPQKILNVYHDETFLTYENKFINTLLLRLYTFVDMRYKALAYSCSREQNYRFSYATNFEHRDNIDAGRSTAKVTLNIELTSPFNNEQEGEKVKDSYALAVERIAKINSALTSYRASAFVEKMGKNYIRPPVIRTNAILKNKNFKECLTLWEFIDGFNAVGYSVRSDAEVQMPADNFISDIYSSVAFQYVDFYNGVTLSENNRLLSTKHLFETVPEFEPTIADEYLEDYVVYDSEYKKSVPVTRFLNNKKNLSDDEKRIAEAITVALRADEIITSQLEKQEALKKKAKEEKKIAEKKAEKKRLIAEEKARLIEEKRQRSLERKRIAEEKRLQKELLRLELEAREAEEKRKAIEEKRAMLLEKSKKKKGDGSPVAKKNFSDFKSYFGKAKNKTPEFTFQGEPSIENVPVIPFTRESYYEMSRRKKKRVVLDTLKDYKK